VTDPDNYRDVPLSQLPADEKAKRAASFGGAASLYERYRPGPPTAAVDWMLPQPVARVVDLGAGTGALTRLLVGRADEVVAVEPDDRMRAVLVAEVPGVRAVSGRGESMPLPDGSVDAVLASSSWHWMDPIPALHEAARVLRPGGTLGAVWSGPDNEGAFIIQARAVLAGQASGGASGSELPDLVLPDADRPSSTLEIPASGTAFDQPEHEVFKWDVALNADELIGLLGTFSWVITLADDRRERVFATARELLRDVMGVEGEVTVDVGFSAEAWRTHRTG
jgi:SAM-dependent methyltransferase